MAHTLRELLILLHLASLVCCITTSDKKEETKDLDAEDYKDDLDTQETGWIFNPLQEKAKTLEYLKDKVFYPFSALKSPASSFGGSLPIYSSGYGHTYYPGFSGKYPSLSFSGSSGSYYQPIKPKQFNYFNPVYTPYKKSYPYYPYKTWYNKNYYSTGGYNVNTGSYAPDCYYPSSRPTVQPTILTPPTYSSGTPLYSYYSSVTPSQTYGAPGFNFGAKTALSVGSTPTPMSYSSHFQPSTISQSPPNSYVWRISSSPQYSDGSAQLPGSSPSLPSVSYLPSNPSPQLSGVSSSTFSPSTIPSSASPSTPSPPFSGAFPPPTFVSSTSPPPLPSFPESIPSGPSSVPVPIGGQNGEGVSQEVIITPPSLTAKGHYVTTLPGPKVALPDPSYQYNQPPSYAVAYYPNVFYITNEQHSEKTTSNQSVAEQGDSNDGSSDDSSDSPMTSSDSQSTGDSPPSTKSQSTVQTLPPGFSTFYSSQTLDQTRIPVPYSPGQLVFPQSGGGFYSAVVPSVYATPVGGGGSSFAALSPGAPAVPLTNTISTSYSLPLAYSHGQSPGGYQVTRTSKNC